MQIWAILSEMENFDAFATPEIPVGGAGLVHVQNRFDVLGTLGGPEAKTHVNIGEASTSRSKFENSSLDNKMVHLFDELRFIRNEQVHCSRGMVHFQQNIGEINETLATLCR